MARSKKTIYPNQIRRYRKMRHLRLRDLAQMTGYKDASPFSHWEKGRTLPTLTNALKLAAAINCPVEVLFCDYYQAICKQVKKRQAKHNIKRQYD